MATDDSLYPELDDMDFNKKIALKKEFHQHQYVGFDKTMTKEQQLERKTTKQPRNKNKRNTKKTKTTKP